MLEELLTLRNDGAILFLQLGTCMTANSPQTSPRFIHFLCRVPRQDRQEHAFRQGLSRQRI